jgi:hypothetical protein
MGIGVRQQCEETRTLDRRVELALIVRLGAGESGRSYLAVLADEVPQRIDVLVVDLVDLFGRERQNFALNSAFCCDGRRLPLSFLPLPLPLPRIEVAI